MPAEQLTANEIVGMLIDARAPFMADHPFSARATARLVAIAGYAGSPCPGESHGRPDARNDSAAGGKWGPAVGLFQIRTLVEETGRGTYRDIEHVSGTSAEKVGNNCAAAWDIWYSSGRDAWAVSAECENENLPEALRAVENPMAPDLDAPGPLDALVDPLLSVTGLVQSIGELLAELADGDNWRRLGLIVGGGLLFLIGFAVTAREVTGASLPLPGPLGTAVDLLA